jgi:Uma2 family endonuclease
MVITKLYTAEDLWTLGEDARFELVHGELRERIPAGERHGDVRDEIAAQLRTFARAHGLRKVTGAEMGFIVRRNPDTVLASDVAFIHEEHLSANRDKRKFVPVPPDFVVEVVSLSDTRDDVTENVALYLTAGVMLVWVADPERRTVAVHTLGQPEQIAREGDIIDGAPVLPGFRVVVAKLFSED